MTYFDYDSAAKKAGVPSDVLQTWETGFEQEYPRDRMMVELRLLRACRAAGEGTDQLQHIMRSLDEEFRHAGKTSA